VEAPHLSEFVDKYAKEGLVILAVNAWDEDKNEVKKFAEKNKLKQRILLNGRSVAYKRYKVPGIPTAVWIDRAGVVRGTDVGFEDPQAFDEKTRQLLKDTSHPEQTGTSTGQADHQP
jgi:cytochrome c biogenesis protein CcmG/thiol:disulfide interchange protein DsbE